MTRTENGKHSNASNTETTKIRAQFTVKKLSFFIKLITKRKFVNFVFFLYILCYHAHHGGVTGTQFESISFRFFVLNDSKLYLQKKKEKKDEKNSRLFEVT